MDACLPDPKTILKHDRSTLDWIRQKTASIPNLRPLYESANNAILKFDSQFGMRVWLNWSVLHGHKGGRALQLHVGGLLERTHAAIDNMSYCICVIDEDGTRVLRKYHFDYANPEIRAKRSSPTFHLQYSGSLPSEIRDSY